MKRSGLLFLLIIISFSASAQKQKIIAQSNYDYKKFHFSSLKNGDYLERLSLNKARKFLEKSIKLDPSSPNSLISLAIVYHIQRDLEKEKPLILRLLKLTPENPQVLRLGVQVAGILKDKEMSENVLELMTKYNREALPLAKKFIENAFKSNQ